MVYRVFNKIETDCFQWYHWGPISQRAMMRSTRQGECALLQPEVVKADLVREEENLPAVFRERERRRLRLVERALV
jgi:hypothetical protein